MRQPNLKAVGKDGFPVMNDDHALQIANHWNIARHAQKKAVDILLDLHYNRKLLSYNEFDELRRAIEDTGVGLHNLGQELVCVDRLQYDYEHAEKESWRKDFGIYEPREKRSSLVPIGK